MFMSSDYQLKFFMHLNKYLRCDHSVSLVTIATLFFDCVLFTFLLDRMVFVLLATLYPTNCKQNHFLPTYVL